jgi:hypothetical protein
MNALSVLRRVGPSSGDQASAVDLLMRTPLDQLDDAVEALKKHRPSVEVRKAMVERIARAPLSDFEALKLIYLKHCGDAAK